MNDVIEIAKARRATLAAEIVSLESFIRMAYELVISGQDTDAEFLMPDDISASAKDLPEADDNSNDAALIFVHVGKRIRHRRWMMGMSQQQLGDRIGTNAEIVQKLETGSSRIDSAQMREIATAM